MMYNRTPQYFMTVVREGNISRAAEKLYISQPSLSQHIARLEMALNSTLFDRSKSPLELTPAGELYRDYLESVAFLDTKLRAELGNVNSSQKRNISIGMGNWRSSVLSPEILPQFLQEYPSAQVKLFEYPVSELMPFIQDGKVDFAVMNTMLNDMPNNLTLETITYERILLVMNRNDPILADLMELGEGEIDTKLHMLENIRFISLANTLIVGRHVDNFIQKNHLYFSNRIRTTNNSTALRMVAKGLGFCFLVETGIDDARRYPELIFFDMNTPSLILPLSICYKANTFFSQAEQRLMDLIRDYYKYVVHRNDSIPLL